MECIDADELNENKAMDEEFLIQRASTMHGNELENENNIIGMESDEKKKELSKTEMEEADKIIGLVKYENEHPNEEIKKREEQETQEQPKIQQENQNIIFNPFIKPWKETEKEIKEKSHFKIFKTLSVISFIAKANDDLRQEVMTMQLIKKYDEIFKSENIPLKLHPYEIIITSNSTGLIEFIPDSISIDGLKRKTNTDLNTFYRKFFHHHFKEAQNNFVESLAGYSLVTYLLNLKDRHNGNIMIDIKGRIIHIDFGFILGISPGNVGFETAPFKMTKES